jgi:SAM-dependent methyltransferase
LLLPQIKSEIIEDTVAKNARHKLMTTYGWIYDLIYPDFLKRMKAENDLLIQEMHKREVSKSVLELGAGSGRQSWLLQREGYDTQALEICQEMVDIGKKKLGAERIHLGDARNFKTTEKMGAVLLGPLVTCYFLNNEDVRRTFSCAKDSLENGGLIFVDFIHSRIAIENEFYNGFSNQQFIFTAPDHGVKRAFINRFNECHLDLMKDVKYYWKSTYIFNYDGRIATDEDTVLLRTFFPSEIESMLRECGFKSIQFYGCDGDNVFPLSNEQKLVSFIAIAEA